jgi:hypothetical protein
MTVVDPSPPGAGPAGSSPASLRPPPRPAADGVVAGLRTGVDLASATDEELCDELRFAAFWCGAVGDGGGIGRVGAGQVRAVLEAAAAELSAPAGDEGPADVGGRAAAADALVRGAREHGAALVGTAHDEATRLHRDAGRTVHPVVDALEQLQAAHAALRAAADRFAPRR